MGRRMVALTAYLTPEQDSMLKLLHQKTGVPVTEYIRRGVDLVLDRHGGELPANVGITRRRGKQERPREDR